MKPFLCFLFAVAFGASCSSGDEIPADVISPDSMKLIMWDMLRAEQYVLDQKDSTHLKQSLTRRSTAMFQKVLNIHHTNKNNFYKSYGYYEGHPDIMKRLLDSLNTYAQKKRGDLYKKIPK